jgi:hypothetical protein
MLNLGGTPRCRMLATIDRVALGSQRFIRRIRAL